ncbi:MAG TPA: methylated-DNA--[protein]-cysteine S-methyltransferase [Micromonosporaceae bacterium]
MNSFTVATPVGPFTVLASGDAVLAAGFTDRVDDLVPLVHPRLRGAADADVDVIAKAVTEYFEGDLTALDPVPVRQDTDGEFLGHAWRVLRSVPPGAPVTYTEFAALAGRPAAVRAAAQACARNAAALFVPCHRVIGRDGGLAGYRWGVDVKRWLLRHEADATPPRG